MDIKTKLFFNIPWNSQKNLGQSYNHFMELLPSDDSYAVFLDGDAMFLHPFFGKQIEDIVQKYPEYGLFTAMTNRVNFKKQVTGDWSNNSIFFHRNIADQLYKEKYDEIEDITDTTHGVLSGVVMVIRKDVWREVGGFSDGTLGVDNDIHLKVSQKYKVAIMKGVYVYHWYRGGDFNNDSHLVNKKFDENNNVINPVYENLKKLSIENMTREQILLKRYYEKQERENKRKSFRKKIIYSAIIGDYDKPIHHTIPDGWEYKLFTNNKNITGDHVIHVENNQLDEVKFARHIKIMPWEYFDFDVCIWIDGNTVFDPEQIKNIENKEFHISEHPERDCIYDEADAIVKFKKDTPEKMEALKIRYQKEGMPRHFGMVASHAIVRHNKPEIRAFCEQWWKEVKENSHRDQMSFNYVLWKNPINVSYMVFKSIFKPITKHMKRYW